MACPKSMENLSQVHYVDIDRPRYIKPGLMTNINEPISDLNVNDSQKYSDY